MYSLTTTLIVFIFLMLIPKIFISQILRLLTQNETIIGTTSYMIHISIPIQISLSLQENIKSYCYSHKIESFFGYISLSNLFLSILTMPFMIKTLELGIYGFVLNRIIFESLNLLIYLFVAIYYLPIESKNISRAFPHFDKSEFASYFTNTFEYICTVCFESICFEIQTIYVAIKMTEVDLAALTASNNITGIIFFSGLGFSNLFRTRLNHLIGMDEGIAAKNFSFWFMKVSLLFCLVIQVVLFVVKDYVIQLYSNNELMTKKMTTFITLYSFFIYIDILPEIIMVVLRSIGLVSYTVKINFWLYIPLCIVINFLFIFIMEWGIWSVLLCFILGMHIVAAIYLKRLQTVDWDNLNNSAE